MRLSLSLFQHSVLLTGALFVGWLVLILILPTVPLPTNPGLHIYPESLDMSNLEPWHYSIARFEVDAIRDILQRSRKPLPSHLSTRDQHVWVRTYIAQYARQREAARMAMQASELLRPMDLARQAHAVATYRELAASLNLHRSTFERIVQQQVADELARAGLTVRTRTFPPVLFRMAEPPLLLIISPRNEIRSLVNVYVETATPLEEIEAYENYMLAEQNLSAYVSLVGGVATYPTTVTLRFHDLSTLFEIVAHEWVHTYLAFHSLGVRYWQSLDFRTLNETAATIIGQEISQRIMLRHYRDLLPVSAVPPAEPGAEQEPAFDFRAAMHETRLETDRLLALGRIAAAEAYMEEQRQMFKGQGYNLRKLNQAYFAFHGTYATAAGSSNPIGPLMRELRTLMPNLRDFVILVQAFDAETDLHAALTAVRYRRSDLEDLYGDRAYR